VESGTKVVTREHSLTLHDPHVELWHQEGGNPMFTYFHVPIGTRRELVDREFLKVGKKWLASMAKDGWIAQESSVACLGPYVIPDYTELDMVQYFIGATFIRRKPQILTIEQAETIERAPRTKKKPGRDVREFLSRLQQLGPVVLEVAAAQNRYAQKKAEEEQKLREEVEEINKSHQRI